MLGLGIWLHERVLAQQTQGPRFNTSADKSAHNQKFFNVEKEIAKCIVRTLLGSCILK